MQVSKKWVSSQLAEIVEKQAARIEELEAKVENMDMASCSDCRSQWTDEEETVRGVEVEQAARIDELEVEKQTRLIEDIAARLLADLTLVDVILDGWTDELIERLKDDGEEIPPQDDIRKEVVDAWKSNAPEGYYGEFESLEVIMIHIEHETKNRK